MGNVTKEVEPNNSKNKNELDYKSLKIQSFPLNILKFELLKILNLSENNLNEKIFLQMNEHIFDHLETLNLNNNQFTNLKYLSPDKFPSLTSLNFSDNKLKSFQELGEFQLLVKLNLSNNQILNIPKGIENLTKLKSLDLSNNQLKSVEELISLKDSIRELIIFKNNKLHNVPIELKSTNIYLDSDLPDEIIPGLFLGSIDSASNTELMKELNIKHILSVCGEIPNSIKTEIQNNFNSKLISVDDNGEDDLKFEECFQFIDNALSKEKILVHCWKGVSRSSSICIYYVMKKQKISLNDAYHLVLSKRPIIQPNPGFIQKLKVEEKIEL
jgi:protein-tyrosine phosphatase